MASTEEIRSNLVLSQIEEHLPYGGVVPEIAARAHLDYLENVIAKALKEANATFSDLDAIAATSGPGLIGGVIVGESRTFQGGIDWLRERGIEVIDADSQVCYDLLQSYIRSHADIWNEDIGEG